MKNIVELKKTQKLREVGTIFGLKFVSTQKRKLIDYLLSSVRNNKKLSVVTPNPEILVAATKDSSLYDAIAQADIRIPDGVGLSLFLPLQIIKGREVFTDLLHEAHQRHLKVYFFGSTIKTLTALKNKITSEYPGIPFKGSVGGTLTTSAEPVTSRDRKLHDSAVAEIKKMRPHIVFVALGAPKQEKWIAKHKTLPANLFIAVGGSFDSFVDSSKVPPHIFSLLHLEWIWRLICEPRRLPRILTAVFIFPLLVIKSKIIKNTDTVI